MHKNHVISLVEVQQDLCISDPILCLTIKYVSVVECCGAGTVFKDSEVACMFSSACAFILHAKSEFIKPHTVLI